MKKFMTGPFWSKIFWFFSSQTTGNFEKLNQLKPVFVEPKKSELFQQTLANFGSAVNGVERRKGAAFFGVCRGKVWFLHTNFN